MCCSDRIVRVTYPKNCTPEVNDSQQLLYNGPALACVDVQTNQTLNDAIKEIDALLCNAENSLIECCNTTTTSTSSSTSTSTTTSTTTVLQEICFNAAAEVFGAVFNQSISPEPTLVNGKVWYKLIVDPLDSEVLYVYWDNTSTYLPGGTWVVGYKTSTTETPPFSASDIWAYKPTFSNYPSDCTSACVLEQWTNTVNAALDLFFTAANKGACIPTTTTL